MNLHTHLIQMRKIKKMKDASHNIFTRCDEQCKSERCDDYGAEVCVAFHSCGTDHESEGFCAKAAFLSGGCEVCQEYWAIHREIQDGEKHLRICHECQYQFELTSENPYNEVLYDEGTDAVYFTCDGCAFSEDEDDWLDEDEDDWGNLLDEPRDDIEDEIDRMAELMEMGRI